MLRNEQLVVNEVVRHLRKNYPNAIYRFDLAADMKLTMGQASRHKSLHPVRGYPDLFIAEPRDNYHGLYIELKGNGVKTHRKDGKLLADSHLKEQDIMLARLSGKGYKAVFCLGSDDAKTTIDKYMGKLDNEDDKGVPF